MTDNSPILITGASKRVGLELAQHLAERGHQVIAVSRSAPSSSHPNLQNLAIDLQSRQSRQTLIDHLEANVPSLRAIIHNASLWLDDDLDDLDTMFRIHVEAPFHLNQALQPLLAKHGRADIVHICDDTASRGSRNHIAYAATKAALLNMTLSFAEKFAPDIRVNAISPGLLILKPDSSEDYISTTLDKALLEFEPGAEPLIQALDYLLGATYSTGSNIVINGGRHLRKRKSHV